MWNAVQRVADPRIRQAVMFTIEQCIPGMSILNRYSPSHYSQSNRVMSGVYYVPSQHSEVSPWYILEGKTRRLVTAFAKLPKGGEVFVSLNSGSYVDIPDNSIDYIFTDPPFGSNLQYSELNWFIESFYRVLPDIRGEAVVNKAQEKGVQEYLELMLRCMKENHRVLKPGRWMTVEFHNSSNAIWNAIQEAILRAGFVVADVRTLD
jgi:adenine-specific DNA methylase